MRMFDPKRSLDIPPKIISNQNVMKKLFALVVACAYILLADHCVAGALSQGPSHNCMTTVGNVQGHDACESNHCHGDSPRKESSTSRECCTTVFRAHPTILSDGLEIPTPVFLVERLAGPKLSIFAPEPIFVGAYRDHGPPGGPQSAYLVSSSLLRAPPSSSKGR